MGLFIIAKICKKEMIRKCPYCKSENITLYMGFQFGKYQCKDCGYIGSLIIEFEPKKNPKGRKE